MSLSLGPYQTLEELGRGGMAVAYRALDTRTGRTVALKILLRPLAPGSNEQRRFQREVAALRKLRHPGVVEVLEAGEHQGRGFLALEYLEGGTLEERIKRKGRLSSGETAELGRALAKALHAAHMEQIVHRDLKPANVLFDKAGKAKLADFGLARSIEVEASRLTQSGVFLGTPGYMAPEQVRGSWEEIGPGADVYGLGATLFACLSGVAPVEGDTVADVLIKTEEGRTRSLRELGVEVDRGLTRIVERCLEREVGDRYASVAALEAALEGYLEGEEEERARVGWWVGGAVAALGLGVGLAWALAEEEVGVAEVGVAEVGVAEVGELVAAGGAPSSAEGWCVEGGRALGEGRLLWAVECLEVAEKLAPSSGEVAELRSRVEREGGRAALARWEARVEADAGDAVAAERRAEVLVWLGEDMEALEAYRELERLEPGGSGRFAWRLGWLWERLGEEERALAAFERGWAAEPGCGWGLRRYGELLSRVGRVEEAEEVFGRCLALAPANVLARIARGSARGGWGDFEGAIEDMEALLVLAPEMEKARLTLAELLNVVGRAEEALEVSASLMGGESRTDACEARAHACVLLKRWEEARSLAEEVLRERPGDRDGLWFLGTALQGLGEHAQALEVLLEVLRARVSVDVLQQVAGLALGLGEHEVAVACFDRLEQIRPLGFEERANRAAGYQGLRRWAEAQADYEECVAAHGERADIVAALGGTLLMQGEAGEAARWFERSLELDGSDARVALNLGVARRMQGEFAEAVEAYELALALNPGDVEAQLQRGEALYGLGEYGLSLAAGAECVRRQPERADALLLFVRSAWEVGDRSALGQALARSEGVADLGLRALIRGIARVGLGESEGRVELEWSLGVLTSEQLRAVARRVLSRSGG